MLTFANEAESNAAFVEFRRNPQTQIYTFNKVTTKCVFSLCESVQV